MRIAFLCPDCEEIVLAVYTNGDLDIVDECNCMVKHGLVEWILSLLKVWHDLIILNVDKIMADGVLRDAC